MFFQLKIQVPKSFVRYPYRMCNLLHIGDLSQFVLQESNAFSQPHKSNSLKLVRSSKERGKLQREKQKLRSSICNLGRAPSSTSGNSTSFTQEHSLILTRAGKAPQHVKDLGRYSKFSQSHKSRSLSCLKACDIS